MAVKVVVAVAAVAAAARPMAIHLRVFMTTTLPTGQSFGSRVIRPSQVGFPPPGGWSFLVPLVPGSVRGGLPGEAGQQGTGALGQYDHPPVPVGLQRPAQAVFGLVERPGQGVGGQRLGLPGRP